jgi:hypothetical protein
MRVHPAELLDENGLLDGRSLAQQAAIKLKNSVASGVR